MSDDHPQCNSVTTLYVNDNIISDINVIAQIGSTFPNLQNLVMIENPISVIQEDKLAAAFPKLRCLNISESRIDSWDELEKLRSFPSLEDLRVQGIPLWVVSLRCLFTVDTIADLSNWTIFYFQLFVCVNQYVSLIIRDKIYEIFGNITESSDLIHNVILMLI